MPSYLNQGKTWIRDQIKAGITHVGFSTDATAFSATHTSLSPGGGTNLIKIATKTNVTITSTDDGFDASATINGTTELTNQDLRTIGLMYGSSASQCVLRRVRSGPIRIEAGDLLTVGVRYQAMDNSA